MNNPVIQRELIGMLSHPKALAIQVVPAAVFGILVLIRWPTDSRVDLSGSQSLQVFGLFGYGMLATMILLVPAFPATSIVREKTSGTLALLLNSPMSAWSIYSGKLLGVLAFVLLPLVVSLPAAAACYAVGGLSLSGDLVGLYLILTVLALQCTAVGLLVSSLARSSDAALRITYGIVLLITVMSLGPHQFLQSTSWGWISDAALWLRYLSPIPPVMEIVGHSDIGGHGLVVETVGTWRYAAIALATTVIGMLVTVSCLRPLTFDRSRPAGVITDDRSGLQRVVRRFFFIIDPQRRSGQIGRFTNPVLVKEFRCRRFGRSQWLFRLVAVSAVASLGLTYASTTGTMDWGVDAIGGMLVVLEVAMIGLITPSLGSSLISSETETGGWALLRATPLSTGQILRGKLLSALWPLILILFATLPGYAVMIFIEPGLTQQISYVLFSLFLTALFALMLSVAVSSLFQRTAPATVTSYSLLLACLGGTLLVWLGRDTTFSHRTVETLLLFNPVAAALSVMGTPGFSQYHLVPTNWWLIGVASIACMCVLYFQTWRLTRPR